MREGDILTKFCPLFLMSRDEKCKGLWAGQGRNKCNSINLHIFDCQHFWPTTTNDESILQIRQQLIRGRISTFYVQIWQRNLKGISKLIVWIIIHPVTLHFSMQSVWKEKQWCFRRYTVFLKHSMWCCCCLWWAPHETCICQVYVSVLHWNNYTYSFAPSFQEKDD